MEQLQNVAIVGAGTQGAMLAFRSLLYGRTVFIYSRREESRQKAKEKIDGWMEDRMQSGKLSREQVEQAMHHLILATTLKEAVSQADIILENIPEILEQKQQLWAEIDALAPAHALLTTNSSSFKSSDIGIRIARKEKTFNVNFMTPTEDDMVEVMWNAATSEETKAMALAFLRSQDHVPVITQKEIKGFSLNRVWRAIKKECLHLWAEGYTTPEDLDKAWMLEWDTSHGPFGLMDKVGLDIVQQIELSYYAESQNPEDLPPAALDALVQAGKLGEKTGEGFYTYPDPAYQKEEFLK